MINHSQINFGIQYPISVRGVLCKNSAEYLYHLVSFGICEKPHGLDIEELGKRLKINEEKEEELKEIIKDKEKEIKEEIKEVVKEDKRKNKRAR